MRRLLIVMMLMLGACHSGWDKDPFVDDSQNIKNAVAQGTDQKGIPPLASVIFIDSNSSYNIKEGQPLNVKVIHRIAHPEFVFKEIRVAGLDDLPGAEFNAATAELFFEAPEDFVPDNTLIYQVSLMVSVIAEYKGTLHEKRKRLDVNVLAGSATQPRIEGFEDFPPSLQEKDVHKFKVYVRDESSPKGPRLKVAGSSGLGKTNGGQYIDLAQLGTPVSGDPSLFMFDGTIDLDRDTDITSSSRRLFASFQAHSVFGVPSVASTQNFSVHTKASELKVFAEPKVEFKKDQMNNYIFSFVDPRAEGDVLAKFLTNCTTDLGENAQCECVQLEHSSRCQIRWSPTAVGEYNLKLEATNTVNANLQAQMNQSQASTEIKISVVE